MSPTLARLYNWLVGIVHCVVLMENCYRKDGPNDPMRKFGEIVAKIKTDRPPNELGSWVLEGLMDAQPSTEITGRREARMDSFLARDGLRKTIKYKQKRRKRAKKITSSSPKLGDPGHSY